MSGFELLLAFLAGVVMGGALDRFVLPLLVDAWIDRLKDGYLRGTLPRTPTTRQVDVLAAFVAAGGSVVEAAALVGVRPSTAKRHLADLRARSGLSTEQLIYVGRSAGWLVVSSMESVDVSASRATPRIPGCADRARIATAPAERDR